MHLPFYKHYPADYNLDTVHLSLEEHGAYRLLIDRYYQTQAPLPDDDVALSRILRITVEHWQTIRPAIASFFLIRSGLWHHKRIDQELKALAAKGRRRAESARHAAVKRWQNGGEKTDDQGVSPEDENHSRNDLLMKSYKCSPQNFDEISVPNSEADSSTYMRSACESHTNRNADAMRKTCALIQISDNRYQISETRGSSRRSSQEVEGEICVGRVSVQPSTIGGLDTVAPTSKLFANAGSLTLTASHPDEKPKRKRTKKPAVTTPVWEAYALAYRNRYGVDPVRNARVSGQLANFVTRVPQAEAPAIAAFFVANSSRYYVERGHPVGLLVADAEKLRTEWATGRRVTSTQARMQDETQTRGDVWGELIAEAEAREEAAMAAKSAEQGGSHVKH